MNQNNINKRERESNQTAPVPKTTDTLHSAPPVHTLWLSHPNTSMLSDIIWDATPLQAPLSLYLWSLHPEPSKFYQVRKERMQKWIEVVHSGYFVRKEFRRNYGDELFPRFFRFSRQMPPNAAMKSVRLCHWNFWS